MNSIQRPRASALVLLALSLAGSPTVAQTPRQPEQRGGLPNGDTPHLVVATFRSQDRALGVTMADEVRKRLQSEKTTKELYVVPKVNITATLTGSGFPTDSALSVSDVMELARSLRSDEVLDGSVSKNAGGVHVEPRLLMKTGQNTLTQPLPPVDAKDLGEAAKQIERALTEASRAIPSYRVCASALVASRFDDATKAARAGLAAYASSNFARLCLLTAFASQKAPADSIILVAKAIVASDPTSMIGLANLAAAYAQKGDTASATDAYVSIYNLDRSNIGAGKAAVREIVSLGRPDRAIPLVDDMLAQSPDDSDLLHTKSTVLLVAGRRKAAIKAAEAWVTVDTSKATLEYYKRQIGIAQQDSDAAMVLQLALKGAEKFPRDAELQLLLAQGYRKSGQSSQALAPARRAAEIEPKNLRTTLLIIYIQNDLNQPDSAMATAQKAIASGQNRDTIGQALLAQLGPALKKAHETAARADWEAALKSAQTVDAIAPSPQSKFYSGLAAFSVAIDALTNARALQTQGTRGDGAKACEELKVVEDNFAIASVAVLAGGRVDPSAAKQILDNIGTYGAYVPQLKTTLRCR